MLIHDRQNFLDQWTTIKPKMQRAFLAGKITYTEAMEFSKRSRAENKGFITNVDLLHQKRHNVLIRQHTDIHTPHADIRSFTDEMEGMPEHICIFVLSGRLTLLQARFAHRNKFGAKSVHDLASVNAEPIPYRARKYKLGTEHSVRNPVKARSHISGRFNAIR